MFLAIHLSTTFLNTGIKNETFQHSGKQDSFWHILKSTATHTSSEQLQKNNSNKLPLTNQVNPS